MSPPGGTVKGRATPAEPPRGTIRWATEDAISGAGLQPGKSVVRQPTRNRLAPIPRCSRVWCRANRGQDSPKTRRARSWRQPFRLGTPFLPPATAMLAEPGRRSSLKIHGEPSIGSTRTMAQPCQRRRSSISGLERRSVRRRSAERVFGVFRRSRDRRSRMTATFALSAKARLRFS